MPERRGLKWSRLLVVLLVVAACWFGWREVQRQVREHPERFPWTPLSLSDPVGPFTARKLAGLTDEPARCRALLDAAGDRDKPAPAIATGNPDCGYADGMIIMAERDSSIHFTPAGLVTSCPVSASLRLWERELQSAALRHLGSRVIRIEHFGSYSCRRLYGGSEGPWSEHSTADAVDIAGFRLADGRRITVPADWVGSGDEAAFLRAARDSACELFATTLSPDYNAAHRDHLHLDQAERGARGGRLCR